MFHSSGQGIVWLLSIIIIVALWTRVPRGFWRALGTLAAFAAAMPMGHQHWVLLASAAACLAIGLLRRRYA